MDEFENLAPKNGVFAKLAQVLSFRNFYDTHIYELFKEKFHFAQYISLNQILEFLDDLASLPQLLAKDYKLAINLLKGHAGLLVPILGIALEVLIKKLPLGQLNQLILLKVKFALEAILCGFWLGISIYFIMQFKDLYSIEMTLREAKKQISSEETLKEIDQLKDCVDQLTAIDQDIQELKKKYQESEDYATISKQIHEKHKKANDVYESASKILVLIKSKLIDNAKILEDSRDQTKVVTCIMGFLFCVSAVATIICPVMGVVAITALSAIGTAWSGSLWYRTNGQLNEIEQKQSEILEFEKELDRLMETIRKDGEFAQEMKLNDPELSFLNDILNGDDLGEVPEMSDKNELELNSEVPNSATEMFQSEQEPIKCL